MPRHLREPLLAEVAPIAGAWRERLPWVEPAVWEAPPLPCTGWPPVVPALPPALPFEGTTGNATCSLCLEDMAPPQLVRALPCGHRFHASDACACPGVDEWLQRCRACPLCRRRL